MLLRTWTSWRGALWTCVDAAHNHHDGAAREPAEQGCRLSEGVSGDETCHDGRRDKSGASWAQLRSRREGEGWSLVEYVTGGCGMRKGRPSDDAAAVGPPCPI